MDYIEIAASPVSMIVYSFIGLSCLAFVYGLYGSLATFIKFLCLGSKRFFKQVDRPKPPSKAMDRIYGTHEMIKLKVLILIYLIFLYKKFILVFRCITSLCFKRFTKSTNDIICSWFS
jgi:hypothetical protein